MKFTVIKVSADGEQVSVEWVLGEKDIMAHRDGKRHLRETLAPMFDAVDARLLEMNKRIMASNYLVQKLSPEARFAVNNVMDVLHGRTTGPAVEKILEASRAEVEAARAKGEAGEEVKGPNGEITGRRRPKSKPGPEPVAQGYEGGPQGEPVSLEGLAKRLEEITGGAE